MVLHLPVAPNDATDDFSDDHLINEGTVVDENVRLREELDRLRKTVAQLLQQRDLGQMHGQLDSERGDELTTTNCAEKPRARPSLLPAIETSVRDYSSYYNEEPRIDKTVGAAESRRVPPPASPFLPFDLPVEREFVESSTANDDNPDATSQLTNTSNHSFADDHHFGLMHRRPIVHRNRSDTIVNPSSLATTSVGPNGTPPPSSCPPGVLTWGDDTILGDSSSRSYPWQATRRRQNGVAMPRKDSDDDIEAHSATTMPERYTSFRQNHGHDTPGRVGVDRRKFSRTNRLWRSLSAIWSRVAQALHGRNDEMESLLKRHDMSVQGGDVSSRHNVTKRIAKRGNISISDAATDGGVAVDLDAPFWSSVKERAGWLVGLLVLQSLSSFIISRNEQLLQEHVIIVRFLTMLVGAGGNAGNQASVRGK
jgi:hypothetical protein